VSVVGPIEKDIPVPPAAGPYLRRVMERMQIGESFVTTYTLSAAWKMAQKVGIEVTVRKVSGGNRVWRIK
jgi:hypothetical protein